jgi:hypothetical protein
MKLPEIDGSNWLSIKFQAAYFRAETGGCSSEKQADIQAA